MVSPPSTPDVAVVSRTGPPPKLSWSIAASTCCRSASFDGFFEGPSRAERQRVEGRLEGIKRDREALAPQSEPQIVQPPLGAVEVADGDQLVARTRRVPGLEAFSLPSERFCGRGTRSALRHRSSCRGVI